jgi:hypothetical protein
MSKKASDVTQVVGTIEAAGASVTKVRGKESERTYSTLRFLTEDNQQVFMDGVDVGRHVDTFVEPGVRGSFFLWKRRKVLWLYAYKAPDGTLVHDLDGAEKTATGCLLGAVFFLGVPLYWFLTTNGYRGGSMLGGAVSDARIGILILSSPMVIVGLLCWWGARAATRNFKMLKESIGEQ